MLLRYFLVALVACAAAFGGASAQPMPLVYDTEDTGADCTAPALPIFRDLPSIPALPDPFAWADTTRGRIETKADWRCRRAEVARLMQHYELGNKPAPPSSLDVTYTNNQLKITVPQGTKSLTITATVTLPNGPGPHPVLIGVSGRTGSLPADIFTSRNIATIQYNVNDVATYGSGLGYVGPFYSLFPNGLGYGSSRGKFVAWAWGISRIIDALEQMPQLNIDPSHIGVTGCSYAGKIALFSGALDERIALTLAQEPGGGGAAAWRVTETLPGSRERINNTEGSWYSQSFLPFFGPDVDILPFDHHQLVGLVAPRALLVLGNPDYEWMAEESNHVSSTAAREIWKALDIPDRFGFSIVAGHSHCQLPASQRPEVEAFVDKFLLGLESADTDDVTISPYTTDLARWITWDTPMLTGGPTSNDAPEVPTDRGALLPNYPNPFTDRTTIDFTVAQTAHVELKVYNLVGQVVTTLVDDVRAAGPHAVTWNGTDATGIDLPAGVYFYKLRVDGQQAVSHRMTYVR